MSELIPCRYTCPHCGEVNELLADPTGGDLQEFTEDCSVCCRPAAITLLIDSGGNASISAVPES